MRPWGSLFLCVSFGLLTAGCPKGNSDFNQGRKAETLQDYDAALGYYQKALKADPYNANYKIKLNQTRFEAGLVHIKQGEELRKTVEMIAEKNRATDAAAEPPGDSTEPPLAAVPPEVKLSRASISLTM